MPATPEEMAYEAPADVSDPKRFPTLARGREEWQRFLSIKRGYVRLDPELRGEFPSEREVNEALRMVVQMRRVAGQPPARRKKTA